MKFVSEDIIEQVIADTENSEVLSEVEQRWLSDYPAITSYFQQDSFSLLTESEVAYLKYIIGVVFLSWEKANGSINPSINPKRIEEIEEANWQKLHGAKAKTFRERLDAFFDGYPQEDLLAFVEDSLQEDEDQLVTGAARDIVFICASTLLDTIISASR